MSRLLHLMAFALVSLVGTGQAWAIGDPNLHWETLESKNFRVTFHSGELEAATHVLDVSERALRELGDEIGHVPEEKTEVILTDQTESANGSATALPQNTVRLFLTAPDDLSPLGDVDDWLLELMTHEYTHILQLDSIRGLPLIVNKVVGKRWAPHHIQPRWLLEGLAVLEESKHTSGGRMRSAIWNMYLRQDFLEDNVVELDQFGHYARRWPQGNIWYLYGSQFLQWIFDTYGEGAIRTMIRDYAGQPIPWGINRSIRRATGKTYEELYAGWVRTMKSRYTEQAAVIRGKGLREGRRITFEGQNARYPRWIPEGTWPGFGGGLAYWRANGHDRDGVYGLPLGKDGKPDGKRAQLLFRTSSDGTFDFAPDGSVTFAMPEVHRNLFTFYDLHRYPRGVLDPSGQNGQRIRLTDGMRAADPALSPDGRQVAFVTNQRGTRYLQIADTAERSIEHVRTLVKSEPFEQVYMPRFSPDGKKLAYSVWTRGGYRDIRLVDVATGRYENLAHDRAVDGGPVFSADGKYLYFHSDRTGIFNVYAYEIDSAALFQVTNVLGGAFYPAPSPDGRTLAYVGYTSKGYDLFVYPLDPTSFTRAEPYVDRRGGLPHIATRTPYTRHAYNPLHTLRPRAYTFETQPGNFGQAFSVGVNGNDIAGFHSFAATAMIESTRPALQGSLSYSYNRLPFDAGLSMYRSLAPRPGYSIGGTDRSVVQENLGATASATFFRSRALASQRLGASYTLARIGAHGVESEPRLDPYDTPNQFRRGLAGVLGLSYNFSNAENRLWSVGAEKGMSLGFNLNVSDPALGSQFRGLIARADLTTYYPMPWLRHHSLALHAGGGLAAGSYPGLGAFYVGGFQDVGILETIQGSVIQGGFVMRGYLPGALWGSQYVLGNAEYRFPIVNFDRGLSTLPLFINRINGNVFFDYGSAFDNLREANFKSGTGAEAWFDLILGYNLSLSIRLGYARGLASTGIDKVYFLAAVPY